MGCGIEIGVKDGRAVASRPLASHPVNRGKLCPKGLSEHYTIAAENRAKYPLLRKNGKLERVSWDGGAERPWSSVFATSQAKYGPESLGVLSTGQLVTEEFYTLGKLVQLGFGTNNYDGNTTLCMATAVSGYKLSFGSDGPPGNYEDMETRRRGSADRREHRRQSSDPLPVSGSESQQDSDCRRSARHQDRDDGGPSPAAEAALGSRAHQRHRAYSDSLQPDRPRLYREAHHGFAELESFLDGVYAGTRRRDHRPQPGHHLQDRVPLWPRQSRLHRLDDGRESQHHRHRDRQRHLQSGAAHRTTSAAPALRRFPSPASATPWARAKRDLLPACRAIASSTTRRTARNLPALWAWTNRRLPAKRGLAYPDIIEAAVAKKIRALWIIATNPLVSYPNQGLLRHGLSNLDFLVVQDGYHPTPTTELADLVLPAAIWGEKEGTYTNSERRVSKVNKAVEPPGEARSDFDIFLAHRGTARLPRIAVPGWTAAEDAFNEWRRVSQGRLCDYSGISYDMLADARRGAMAAGGRRSSEDISRLYADGNFQDRRRPRKADLRGLGAVPGTTRRRYPFVLNTGRTVEHWHTRTKTREVPILERLSPRAWLEMNPRDAQAARAAQPRCGGRGLAPRGTCGG